MIDVILERYFNPPMTRAAFLASADDPGGCLELHGVRWNESLMSRDGRHVVCWFQSADLESVRLGLGSETDHRLLWRASVHDAPDADEAAVARANVVVQRVFDNPVDLDDIQAIEDAGADCLRLRDVTFVRTLFAADRTRMICLYHAPDAESVRAAQREAGMPFDAVWPFEAFRPGPEESEG